VIPNALMASATQFGREYMAFSDGLMGQDLPRQYDDTHLDRVSQIGSAEGPVVADITTTGTISPGVHQCSVIFVTRQGYWTAPSPPISWTAAGGKKAIVTNIPTGPSNVVQRLLAAMAFHAWLTEHDDRLRLAGNDQHPKASARRRGHPRTRPSRDTERHTRADRRR